VHALLATFPEIMPASLTCTVPVSQSLRAALVALEQGGVGIALVVDDGGRLLGTLTDGDIRRALLAGTGLDEPLAPCVQRQYTAVAPGAGRAEVLDLMQARSIEQVPVVDDEQRLVGLHLIHELLGAVERPNWAVIMAGGQGTRLRPYTQTIPKPMLRVAGRPILERLVLHLIGYGVKRVYLAVNYLSQQIEDHFEDGREFGCQIEYLREEEFLGTGGPLSLLPEAPADPLFVLNGDLVTQCNLAEMLEHHQRCAALATLGVRRYVHQVPFGCVETDGDRLKRIEEKPALTRLVNAGVYVLEPELLPRIPKATFPITNLFEDCLGRGENLAVYEITDDWVDVGQHDQLKQAREGKA
jgi:dTDP-glucose pyrophosphorylase/CBS domain-containing protein